MKHYDDEDTESKRRPLRLVARILALALVAAAGVLLFAYRDALWLRVSRVFAAADEDPIPVAKLTREAFRVTVPATGEVVGMDTTPVPTPNTPSGSLRLAYLIPEGTLVQPNDLLVRFDSTDAKLSLERQQNTLGANQERTKITTSKQQTDEKVLALDRTSAEMDYEYAMTVMPQDETIFSKWDIITAQVNANLSKERIEYLKARAKTQQRIARSDQQILAIERNRAQSEISVLERTLNSLELRSPVAGLALYRRDRMREPQIGDESQPGQVLVEVVDLEILQARIYVLERDGGNLAKGQDVVIRLDAIPEKEYHGVIRSVSAVAQSLQRNSPLRYFTCDVGIVDAGPDLKRIRPGMYLRGDVVLGDYESCFVVPSSAVTYREKEQKYLVYLRKGDSFEAREVETGLSAHGEAVILKGVEENEIIALRNPFETRKLYLPDFSKGTQAGGRRGPGPGMGGMGPGGGMQIIIRTEGGRR